MVTWINALARTRNRIGSALTAVFKRSGAVDEDVLEELEETLLAADVPLRLIMEWTTSLREGYRGLDVSAKSMLRERLLRALASCEPFDWPPAPRPHTTLIVGVNGAGKTTTTAKLAWRAQAGGLTPLLAATDTFRAAGADQLRIWADRVGCDVVAGQQGADAAAVAFDALAAAQARGRDVVLVDTAGRMHTRKPLMDELGKVRRAIQSRIGREPDETWIVLDASMGQNAITQARQFHQVAPLTGCIIAKLDGSAKAGFVFAVVHELGIPVRFAGLGEGMGDLTPFDATAFVDALLEDE